MQLDSINLRLRPRVMWESCDLGVRLLQSWLRSVFTTYLAVALPLFALFIATYEIAGWLPVLLIWMSKPWLDRTILFALSRALFGESTTPIDVWEAQRGVWWSQLLQTLTLRRLTGSRSFTQPILQLERLTGSDRRKRVQQLVVRHRGVARTMTQAFTAAELALVISLMSLEVWLTPHAVAMNLQSMLAGFANQQGFELTIAYAAAVAFLEPFYVAAGFGMYLNRRVELEAWDIEQEFRRAFAA
jgi:hypothetical protein